MSPEEALRDNKRFRSCGRCSRRCAPTTTGSTRWSTSSTSTSARTTDKIKIIDVPAPAEATGETAGDTQGRSSTLPFGIEEWRDAIYARSSPRSASALLGDLGQGRRRDRPAAHHPDHRLLADPTSSRGDRSSTRSSAGCAATSTTASPRRRVEMLAQHLITRPVFEALFGGYDFAATTPSPRRWSGCSPSSTSTPSTTRTRAGEVLRLGPGRLEGVDNAEGRQRIIVELYDKFFATAFKKTVDKLGIVYTPVEIVDFILNSADEVLREHFGQGLTDEGVHILDGFTGTGTFMVRLLQLGLIKPEDLARKYATNCTPTRSCCSPTTSPRSTSRRPTKTSSAAIARRGGPLRALPRAHPHRHLPVVGGRRQDDLGVFPENNERLNRSRPCPSPSSSATRPTPSGRTAPTTTTPTRSTPPRRRDPRRPMPRSRATARTGLYDSYIRAIKWATFGSGTAASSPSSPTAAGSTPTPPTGCGCRSPRSLATSMSSTFEATSAPLGSSRARRAARSSTLEARGRRSPSPFLSRTRSKVTGRRGSTTRDIGDYLTREQKLAQVSQVARLSGLMTQLISPNSAGDWLNQRRDDFGSFIVLGDKRGVIFLHDGDTRSLTQMGRSSTQMRVTSLMDSDAATTSRMRR
jgi:hypothetical protein